MANLREVAAAVEARGKPKYARATVLLPLPLFGGAYSARFGVLDAERLAEFEAILSSGAELPPEEELALTAGFVSDACRQLSVMSEDGKPEALMHDDGRQVRFDEEFCEALGLAPPPGREKFESGADVVLACWTVESDGERAINATALNGFSNRLFDWMQDTSRRVQGELVGESQGTRP